MAGLMNFGSGGGLFDEDENVRNEWIDDEDADDDDADLDAIDEDYDEDFESDDDDEDEAIASLAPEEYDSEPAAKTTELGEASHGRGGSRRGIGRIVIVALAGLAGVIIALSAFMFLLRSSNTPVDTSQNVTNVSSDTSTEDGENEMSKPSSAMLDEITDTGNGYGVTKLLADSSSEKIALKGRIKNLSDDVHENVAIGVYLYDRDNTVLGVATGFVDRIEPGEVAEFVANADMATSDVANVALAEVRW